MADTCEQHENSFKLLVDEMQPRPSADQILIKCGRCETPMIVELQWWRCMNDGCEGKWWIKENLDELHVDYYYCNRCLAKERAACSR